MQGNMLEAVRRRFASRMDQDQLTGILTIQTMREYFDEPTLEGSFRHGIIKIKTDRHDIVMKCFSQKEQILKLIYQKRGSYGLPARAIKKIIVK